MDTQICNPKCTFERLHAIGWSHIETATRSSKRDTIQRKQRGQTRRYSSIPSRYGCSFWNIEICRKRIFKHSLYFFVLLVSEFSSQEQYTFFLADPLQESLFPLQKNTNTFCIKVLRLNIVTLQIFMEVTAGGRGSCWWATSLISSTSSSTSSSWTGKGHHWGLLTQKV